MNDESSYFRDGLDDVPEIPLQTALDGIRNGEIPARFSRCLVLLLDSEDGNYQVRHFSSGLTHMEVVSLLEAHKFYTLQTSLGTPDNE